MKSSAPLPVSDARASSVGSEKTLRKPPRHSRSAVAVLQQETAAQHPRVPGPALASRGGLASSPGKQATAFPLPPLKHTNRAKSVTTTVSKRSFITQPAGNCRESDARASRPTLPGRVSTGVAGGKLHAAPSAFQASSGRAASVSFATMCERSVPDVQSLLGSLSDETDWSPDPGASLSWASSNSTSAASSVILSSSEGSLLPTQDDLPRKRHGAVPRSRRRAGSRMQRAGSETNTKRPGLPRGSERPTLFDVPLPKPERLPLDLTPYLAEGGEKPAERTAPTQTDAFHLLPGDAPFVPAKRGVDAATQLFGDEELFHFAEEVSPLVDVLVWKTLDEVQSELGHEAELEAMVAYRTACVERCRARLEQEAQAERLERLRAENTRMLIEFNERKIEQEVLVVRKLLAVEAAELTPFYPLVACCLDGLRAQGAFIEDATVAVQTRTMVQLHQNIETALAQLVLLEDATKEILRAEISCHASSSERFQREYDDHERVRRIRDRRVMDIRRGRLHFTLRVEDIPPLRPLSPAAESSFVRSEEGEEGEIKRKEADGRSEGDEGDDSSPSSASSAFDSGAGAPKGRQFVPHLPGAGGRRGTQPRQHPDRTSGAEETTFRGEPEEAAPMKQAEEKSRRPSNDSERHRESFDDAGAVKAYRALSTVPHQTRRKERQTQGGPSRVIDTSVSSVLGSDTLNGTDASSETETESHENACSQSPEGQGDREDADLVFSVDIVVGPLTVVKCSETRECFAMEEVREAISTWISEHVPDLEARARAGFDVVWKNAVQTSVESLLQSLPGELYLKPRPENSTPQKREQKQEAAE